MTDWTVKDGVSNTSDKFVELCDEVERLIRGDAHTLISGNAHRTARLIMGTLAHKHGLHPNPNRHTHTLDRENRV